MSDFPDELQTIKIEQTVEKSSSNLKEKLFLHVKRRLQPENSNIEDKSAVTCPVNDDTTASKHNEKQKETKRRPYQKRTDKTKIQISEGNGNNTINIKHKNKKHKTKLTAAAVARGSNKVTENSNTIDQFSSFAAATTVCGEDEGSHDGSQETEIKTASGREKDKCPDVLAMVLSIKKQALLQDPEVQDFLKEIMSAIKK